MPWLGGILIVVLLLLPVWLRAFDRIDIWYQSRKHT